MTIPVRQGPFGTLALTFLGASLLLAATVATSQGGDSVRLTQDEMDQARGGDPGYVRGTFQCNSLAGLASCTGPGACQTCPQLAYYKITNDPGGYVANAGGPQTCENIYNGTCVQTSPGNYTCHAAVGGNTGMPCGNVPDKPGLQSGPPGGGS